MKSLSETYVTHRHAYADGSTITHTHLGSDKAHTHEYLDTEAVVETKSDRAWHNVHRGIVDDYQATSLREGFADMAAKMTVQGIENILLQYESDLPFEKQSDLIVRGLARQALENELRTR